MSTVYNRRRGGKANGARKARQCWYLKPPPYAHNQSKLIVDAPIRCIAIAPVNRYCPDHQLRAPALPEGPISRRFRLAHQANQQKEAARMRGEHFKLSAATKAHNQNVKKRLLVEGFLALFGYKAKKKASPWAS